MYRAVGIWLIIGLIMILIQIALGGVTRLTGSGLSITKWEIVTGTIPPLNERDWEGEFELYQQTPQYQKINRGMELGEFKVIYFWEYFHRLWARLIGLVFLVPFIIFLVKKALPQELVINLMIMVGLAGLVASFGWVMVASGLINRPWVNAYKLTLHLALACLLFVFALFVVLDFFRVPKIYVDKGLMKMLSFLFLLTVMQILIGGIVAGSKAAMMYTTWPDMNGSFIPDILLRGESWKLEHLISYEMSPVLGTLSQFVHRVVAYIILIVGIFCGIGMIKAKKPALLGILMMIIIVIQVGLGILTVINSKGLIPLYYGLFHQLIGITFLGILSISIYCFNSQDKSGDFSTLETSSP